MTTDKQFEASCNCFLQTFTEEYAKGLHICILQYPLNRSKQGLLHVKETLKSLGNKTRNLVKLTVLCVDIIYVMSNFKFQ